MFRGLLANSDIRYFDSGQSELAPSSMEDGASCDHKLCRPAGIHRSGDQGLMRDQASRMVKLMTKLITDMSILPPALGTRAAGNAGR